MLRRERQEASEQSTASLFVTIVPPFLYRHVNAVVKSTALKKKQTKSQIIFCETFIKAGVYIQALFCSINVNMSNDLFEQFTLHNAQLYVVDLQC